MPTIVGEFGAVERFGWVASAYLLASCAVMPLYGKPGDLIGRKYVLLAAIVISLVGSLTCGLAVSMNTLIAAGPSRSYPLSLLANKSVALFILVSITSGAVAIGMVNYLALYLQTVCGLSADSGRLMSITGRYKPYAVMGLARSTICFTLLALFSGTAALAAVAVIRHAGHWRRSRPAGAGARRSKCRSWG